MKIAGRKIPKGNILVFISFAVISLCLIMISSLSRQEKLNHIMRKGLYSGHEKWFEISECKDVSKWDSVLEGLKENYDDFAMYVNMPDPEISARGVYVSGEVVKPPIIDGAYFDETTSDSNEPIVVVGKEFENKVINKNGKKYFDYFGTECKVLGIMGTVQDSRINHMLLMNFKSALKYSGVNGEYTYDVKKKKDLIDIGNYISENFKDVSDLFIVLNSSKVKTSFIKFLFSEEMIMDTVYIMMLLSFIVSTMLVTLIWIRKRKSLLIALDLCGVNILEKVREIAKRYYVISIGGFFLGVVIIMSMEVFMGSLNVVFKDILHACTVTIGIGTFVLVYSIIRRMLIK